MDIPLNQDVLPLESSGQKRVGAPLDGQSRLKKAKQDHEEEEDIQVTPAPNGFTPGYDAALMQSPSGREVIEQRTPSTPLTSAGVFSLRQDSEGAFEYDISQSGRKTGRMAGAKGYSQQEIQALFSFIREKPPVDNSDWVTMAMKYNAWAKENKKSPRTGRGLKDKLRKVALVSKEDKMKSVPLNPIQQEARECIKLINIATSMISVDPEKEDDSRVLDLNCSLGEQRGGPADPGFSFQPAQLNDLAALLRTILAETRQASQRLSSIEQILESLKGTNDCPIDDMHPTETHSESKDICG